MGIVENALNELLHTPIAATGGLASVFAAMFAVWLAMKSNSMQTAAAGGAATVAGSWTTDLRMSAATIALMLSITAGFAYATRLTVGMGVWITIVASLSLVTISITVTSILSGTLLRGWLASVYGVRTINKQKVGYYGSVPYSKFVESVGHVISTTTIVVFSFFMIGALISNQVRLLQADSPMLGAHDLFFIIAMTLLMAYAFPASALALMLAPWSRFLFTTHARI